VNPRGSQALRRLGYEFVARISRQVHFVEQPNVQNRFGRCRRGHDSQGVTGLTADRHKEQEKKCRKKRQAVKAK